MYDERSGEEPRAVREKELTSDEEDKIIRTRWKGGYKMM